jgi:endonuclease/exonuclease/phosphatase family metal-dependent hydrolase
MVTILAALAGAAPLAPVSAAPTPGQATVLTFNMCGEHCNADNTGAPISALMQVIDTNQPAAVFLQEVCRKQYKALKKLSAEPGNWRLYGFTDVTEPKGCDGGKDSFGDAILTHTPINAGSVDAHALKYPFKGQTRKVLCLSTDAFLRTTEVCTTHIGLPFQIGTAHQAKQIHEAYARARSDGHDVPLVLGGDFNNVPTANALDAVYHSGGGGAKGAMQEVNACPASLGGRSHHSSTCNEYTQEAVFMHPYVYKHDYIFVSRKSFKGLSAEVLPSTYSDHAALLGIMTECASGTC